MDCSEVPAGILSLWNSDTGQRPNNARDGPINEESGMALVPLVPPLYNRPQGEMLRALCISLIPAFDRESKSAQRAYCGVFSELLTRNGVSFINILGNHTKR